MTYFLELCKYDYIYCSSLIALLHKCSTVLLYYTVWVGSYDSNKLWPLPCFWFTSVLVMWTCAYPCVAITFLSLPVQVLKKQVGGRILNLQQCSFRCLFLAIFQWDPPKEKQQQKGKGNVFVYSCGCVSDKSVHHTAESCSIWETDR